MAEIPQSSFQGPLAPKMGFGDSFKSPLHENQQNSPPPKSSGRNLGRLVPYGAIAIALLVLPLTISQLSQQQDIRQRASEPIPTPIQSGPTIILPTEIPTPTPAPIESEPTPSDEIASPSATPGITEEGFN